MLSITDMGRILHLPPPAVLQQHPLVSLHPHHRPQYLSIPTTVTWPGSAPACLPTGWAKPRDGK